MILGEFAIGEAALSQAARAEATTTVRTPRRRLAKAKRDAVLTPEAR